MRGVWIEIANQTVAMIAVARHSPCGECGLKFDLHLSTQTPVVSLPMRGVWIEMHMENEST